MMSKLREVRVCFLAIFFLNFSPLLVADETLPPLKDDKSPQTFEEMWAGFDPRKEPLDVEVLKEWEEDSVVLKVLRYRIGVFKGQMAMMAAVYGYPKGRSKLPGLVQIHGGGQYTDHKACLANAKRGYATISIAWAGRINAPDYRVTPNEVKLFWDGKTNDPKHKLTTDWGAVDGYHAPVRNPGNVFPSAKTAAWTLDEVESPRNSGWFLCALASRRALTFLEQQPQVDASKLGVYGHSMGGKLTVLTTGSDDRVKAAAPSCGGISDRNNKSAIYRATLGDDVSLKKISCPIVFLSPSNDFHGLLGDLPKAIDEIAGNKWRVTCSPHHNQQDTPQYEVATMLWMDQHLKDSFLFPQTPETPLSLKTDDGVPIFCVQPDLSKAVLSVDVFYTQHGNAGDEPEDMQNAKHRFWHYAKAEETSSVWTAKLPLSNIEKPLWVYANVTYSLDEPVSGAGYYYRIYTAKSFNVSSLLQIATPNELMRARTRATLKPSLLIESFEGEWEKEWFTYKPDEWARSTHKIADEIYAACDEAALAVDVLAQQANTLVFVIDNYAAEIQLSGGNQWQAVVLRPQDFRDADGDALRSWKNIKRLKLTPAENLKLKRGSKVKSKVFGKAWTGAKPRFRNLRWQVETNSSKPKKKRPSAQKDAGKDSTENLAPLATLSGSGEDFGSAIDGIKQQDGKGEWIGGSPNAWYGWINYPKLELKWKTSRKINKVVLYDRPMAEEHMAACVLKFSDDSEVHVTAVPNDGSPKTVVFEPRTVTGMTMTVTDGIGTKIGLSEIEVYYDKSAKPESERKKKFTDFVSYVDPTIETGRGRWFFCTPGSRPFGMICASAYTRNKNQGGGGYNFNSTEVLGFAQIHAWIMSGINIMPTTGEVNANLGEKEWKSSFSHETETIEPGYHKLYLDRYKTQVEYTSTDRVAFYRLKYNEAASSLSRIKYRDRGLFADISQNDIFGKETINEKVYS